MSIGSFNTRSNRDDRARLGVAERGKWEAQVDFAQGTLRRERSRSRLLMLLEGSLWQGRGFCVGAIRLWARFFGCGRVCTGALYFQHPRPIAIKDAHSLAQGPPSPPSSTGKGPGGPSRYTTHHAKAHTFQKNTYQHNRPTEWVQGQEAHTRIVRERQLSRWRQAKPL